LGFFYWDDLEIIPWCVCQIKNKFATDVYNGILNP